jgi:hypothetical protein
MSFEHVWQVTVKFGLHRHAINYIIAKEKVPANTTGTFSINQLALIKRFVIFSVHFLSPVPEKESAGHL